MIHVAGPFIYIYPAVNPNYWDYGILGSHGFDLLGLLGSQYPNHGTHVTTLSMRTRRNDNVGTILMQLHYTPR
jgi:hypothetical protein